MFRDRLIGLRTKLGLSQQALAAALGIHYRTIQYWERPGSNPPDGKKLQDLSSFFHVPITYLIGVDPPTDTFSCALNESADHIDPDTIQSRCRAHIDEFLIRCDNDPSKLHWTWIELQDRFPLTKFARSNSRSVPILAANSIALSQASKVSSRPARKRAAGAQSGKAAGQEPASGKE